MITSKPSSKIIWLDYYQENTIILTTHIMYTTIPNFFIFILKSSVNFEKFNILLKKEAFYVLNKYIKIFKN